MTVGFGAFGKITGLGDFLRLNIPVGFVQVWDDWLQANMLAARDMLGAQWEDMYLSAPMWRFTLPAGLVGPHAVSGVWMASVDRVGRQFPLTLVAPHSGTDMALIHFANRATFEQLEEIALATLEDDASRDGLAAALDPLGIVVPDPVSPQASPYSAAVSPETCLAAATLNRQHSGDGIWTSANPMDHRMLLRPHLPDAADMLALINLDAPLWSGHTAEPAA